MRIKRVNGPSIRFGVASISTSPLQRRAITAWIIHDMGWAGSTLSAVAGEFEPGGEVRLHGARGPATAIDGSASRRTGGRHGDSGWAIERRQLCVHTVVASMPPGCSTRALARRVVWPASERRAARQRRMTRADHQAAVGRAARFRTRAVHRGKDVGCRNGFFAQSPSGARCV